MKLTATQVRNAKPHPDGKPNKLSDGRGIRLVITATSKTWTYRYKRPNSKETTVTLGHYPEMSLQDARDARVVVGQQIKQGIDPNTQKKKDSLQRQIAGTTFKDVFQMWFDTKQSGWKPDYRDDVLQRCQKHLFPYIGNRELDSITRKEMINVFMVMSDACQINTLNKVRSYASRVFKYGVNMELIEFNPTADISSDLFKTAKVVHYSHTINKEELSDILNMIESYHGAYFVSTALKLLPLLFLRSKELSELEWSEVDFEQKIIRINNEKMKMGRHHTVPLSSQAFDLLMDLKRIKSDNRFVFPSSASKSGHVATGSIGHGLKSAGIKTDLMTPHGFRHTASTILHENGFNSDAIETQLAHKGANKIKATYNHAEYLEDRREMMQWWSDYLDKLKALNK